MKSIELANFPGHFQQESLKLVNSFLKLKSSAFYLIGPNMQHRGLVTQNMAREEDKLYQSQYMHMDPLNPSLHETGGETVVHMDSILSPQAVDQSVYYQEFLKPMDYRYVTDMFFRSGGKIIAVITMLRDQDQGPFTGTELEMLKKLQPFLEYTLNSVYLPERIAERRTIEQKYQLTARELDVLELVLAGASNKLMARELVLGLPTIKTHLQHIYRKTGVATRTELLSRVMADLNAHI